MKVKHTKLKKSIFLILICISLTTTFVVSASAVETSSTVTLNYPGGSLSFPFQYFDTHYNQIFDIGFFSSDQELDGQFIPAGTSFILFHYGEDIGHNIESYPLSPIFFTGFVDSYSVSVPFDGVELSSIPIVYDDVEGVSFASILLQFGTSLNYTITFNLSSSSPSFTDSVGSGLTSSLSWVGQVVESLTNGSIKPLLGCFAVTISVSAVLLGIYSIKRFIWGK